MSYFVETREPGAASAIERPLRFGVWLKSLKSATTCAELARAAERLGYSTAFVGEHLDSGYGPLVMASAIASATSELRVGTLMLLNDLHHPAVLAKEAAALDNLSGGRLELGVGAGWKERDYTAIGRSMPAGAVRIQQLRETIAILKGLFAYGPFSFSGVHYTIDKLDGLPKPLQRPHPPLIVGGASRAVMATAGADADIAGINPALRSGPLSPETVSMRAAQRTVGYLIESAGDRMAHIEVNLLPLRTVVTRNTRAAIREVARDYALDEATIVDSPFFLIGSPGAIAERLLYLRERLLVSYIVIREDVMVDFADVIERLAPVTRLAARR